MVQKQIYFCWGNQPMSFLRYMTIKSFSFFNPDWQIFIIKNSLIKDRKTWITSEEFDIQSYNGHDFRDELYNIKRLNIIDVENVAPFDYKDYSNVHLKDVLNWYLLSTRSCVVADMDIIFCGSMGECDSFDWNAHVNLCNYDFYGNYIPVSFMVSDVDETGKNRFYDEVFQNSLQKYDGLIYESCGTKCIPYGSIYKIKEKFPELNVNKMNEDVVFPFIKGDITNVGRYFKFTFESDNLSQLTKSTVGIHWYGGNPTSQKYNNQINKEMYTKYNNTICNIIKKII